MKPIKHTVRRFYKIGLGMITMLVIFWFSIGLFVAKGERPLANGKFPYVIVLGAGVKGETPSLILKYRIEAAARYGKQFPETTFILSGGQGKGEAITEAEAMRRGMRAAGIAADRLLLEDQSTSTTENLAFSKRLLPDSENQVSIVTSDFHLYRARKEAEQLNLRSDAIPAETPLSGVLRYGMRERVAIIVKYLQ
ncbi:MULTISPECIES: YdcF family protein [Exiguobacterium]|uniref:YdcF family protein n=1 Tax=Exiguobacterium TaxID=33986 RepID=UPI00054FF7C0|nr:MULTISPECIES: YdcF family protein [Exiguobacterium]MCT4781528.1 YdcF family protein [Exiguobacterium soli]